MQKRNSKRTFFLLLLNAVNVFLHLNSNNVIAQTILAEDLFSHAFAFNDRYIRISTRIKDEFGLTKEYMRYTYFNVQKTQQWTSDNYPNNAKAIYTSDTEQKIIELYDDGQHYDEAIKDGIYSNYTNMNLDEYRTYEYEIDVCCLNDSVGINYNILSSPTNYVPSTPLILSPRYNSTVSTTKPILQWSTDINSDGCQVILLEEIPQFGHQLEGIIWKKDYTRAGDSVFSEIIPINLTQGKTYYIIVWTYVNPTNEYSNYRNSSYSIESSCFSVDTTIKETSALTLHQNYPNPFNSTTQIKFEIPEPGLVSLTIYDLLGKEVVTLFNEEKKQGAYVVTWGGKDNYGRELSSGVYFYLLKTGVLHKVRKLIFLK